MYDSMHMKENKESILFIHPSVNKERRRCNNATLVSVVPRLIASQIQSFCVRSRQTIQHELSGKRGEVIE